MPVVLAWLYRCSRPLYRRLRNTVLATWLISVPVYAMFPVAPPRLAGVGLVDTITTQTGFALDGRLTTALYNPLAAVPSLHAGFAIAVSAALAASLRGRAARTGGWLWAPLVALAVVATGNHFVFDIVAGAVATGAGFLVGEALAHRTRRFAPRPTRHPSPPLPLPPVSPIQRQTRSIAMRTTDPKRRRHRHGRRAAAALIAAAALAAACGPQEHEKPDGVDIEQEVPAADTATQAPTAPASTTAATMPEFLDDVLGLVHGYWSETFAASGLPAPTVGHVWVAPGQQLESACGPITDQDAAYCPGDDTMYIGQQFAFDLWSGTTPSNGSGVAIGDFGLAEVVAHEYGHNVQHELDLEDTEGGSVKPVELQADCLAGLWANSAYELGLLEPGDLEEALSTTLAVGDFEFDDPQHHGTPEERRTAWLAGYSRATRRRARVPPRPDPGPAGRAPMDHGPRTPQSWRTATRSPPTLHTQRTRRMDPTQQDSGNRPAGSDRRHIPLIVGWSIAAILVVAVAALVLTPEDHERRPQAGEEERHDGTAVPDPEDIAGRGQGPAHADAPDGASDCAADGPPAAHPDAAGSRHRHRGDLRGHRRSARTRGHDPGRGDRLHRRRGRRRP